MNRGASSDTIRSLSGLLPCDTHCADGFLLSGQYTCNLARNRSVILQVKREQNLSHWYKSAAQCSNELRYQPNWEQVMMRVRTIQYIR